VAADFAGPVVADAAFAGPVVAEAVLAGLAEAGTVLAGEAAFGSDATAVESPAPGDPALASLLLVARFAGPDLLDAVSLVTVASPPTDADCVGVAFAFVAVVFVAMAAAVAVVSDAFAGFARGGTVFAAAGFGPAGVVPAVFAPDGFAVGFAAVGFAAVGFAAVGFAAAGVAFTAVDLVAERPVPLVAGTPPATLDPDSSSSVIICAGIALFGAFRTAPARSDMAIPQMQNGRAAGRRALRRWQEYGTYGPATNMPHPEVPIRALCPNVTRL
jgi:hypothetical protein